MTGEMQVDRRRGWMTDSRFTLVVVSLVASPGGAAARADAVPDQGDPAVAHHGQVVNRR